MTDVPCNARYDVSGELCGEPAVRAYRSRFSGSFAFRCEAHSQGPGLARRGGRGLWRELSVAEAVVMSVMERVSEP